MGFEANCILGVPAIYFHDNQKRNAERRSSGSSSIFSSRRRMQARGLLVVGVGIVMVSM